MSASSTSMEDRDTTGKRPRRRVQFSLRTLFLLVTAFGLWLGHYLDPIRRLERRLRDDSEQVRLAAIDDLASMGLEAQSAHPSLAAAVHDPSELIRSSAVWALSRTGADWHTLTPLLSDKELRISAAEAILWCGGDPAVVMPVLIDVKTQEIRKRASPSMELDELLEALGPGASAAAMPVVLASLAAEDSAEQKAASNILQLLPRPAASVLPALRRFLRHESPDIRLAAA